MAKYIIDWGNMKRNFEGTLEACKTEAEIRAGHTEKPILIKSEEGEILARRDWCSARYDPEDVDEVRDPICFGDFGYYADWVDT